MSPKRCCAKTCFNSQVSNKNVSYFGFPKNELYAHQWAVAAGRPELTEKSIQKLNKYWLCSEHFTVDCFSDPPANTRLKKSIRPVKVPIPTIFENNLRRFIRKSQPQDDEIMQVTTTRMNRDEHLQASKFFTIDNVETTILVIPESLTIQQENCSSDDVNYTEVEETDSQEKLNYIDSDDSETDHDSGLADVVKRLCRLCASDFDSDQLVGIFSNTDISNCINFVLPGEIEKHDGYSQLICSGCFDKAKQCVGIITEFREAQKIFQHIGV